MPGSVMERPGEAAARCGDELERGVLAAWDRLTLLLPGVPDPAARSLSAVALFDGEGRPVVYPDGSNPIWIAALAATVAGLGDEPRALTVEAPAGLEPLRPWAVGRRLECGLSAAALIAAQPAEIAEAAARAVLALLSEWVSEIDAAAAGDGLTGAAAAHIVERAEGSFRTVLGALLPGTGRARALVLPAARTIEASVSATDRGIAVSVAGARDTAFLRGAVLGALESGLGLPAQARPGLFGGVTVAAEGDDDDGLLALAIGSLSQVALLRLGARASVAAAGGAVTAGIWDGAIAGSGARADRDGENAAGLGVAGVVDIGDLELRGATRTRRVAPRSAGAGRFRGGHGIEVELPAGGEATALSVLVPGVFGGLPGAPGHVDGSTLVSPGGPGWGDPLDRAPEAVLADVQGGLLPVEAARDVYGVVVFGSGVVDEDATRTLRDERRQERLRETGGAVRAVREAPTLLGVAEPVVAPVLTHLAAALSRTTPEAMRADADLFSRSLLAAVRFFAPDALWLNFSDQPDSDGLTTYAQTVSQVRTALPAVPVIATVDVSGSLDDARTAVGAYAEAGVQAICIRGAADEESVAAVLRSIRSFGLTALAHGAQADPSQFDCVIAPEGDGAALDPSTDPAPDRPVRLLTTRGELSAEGGVEQARADADRLKAMAANQKGASR